MSDTRRQTAVEAALRSAALALLARTVTATDAIAIVAPAMAGNSELPVETPRELDARLDRERREKIVAYVNEQERAGNGRGAAMRAARKFAEDRHDPVEVGLIAKAARTATESAARGALPPRRRKLMAGRHQPGNE